MKIRNKLIRLLGGITKEEHFMSGFIADSPCVVRSERPLETLKASYQYDPTRIDESYVHNELASNIKELMIDRGLFKFWTEQKVSPDGSRYDPVMHCMAVVVNPKGDL